MHHCELVPTVANFFFLEVCPFALILDHVTFKGVWVAHFRGDPKSRSDVRTGGFEQMYAWGVEECEISRGFDPVTSAQFFLTNLLGEVIVLVPDAGHTVNLRGGAERSRLIARESGYSMIGTVSSLP